MDEKLKASLLTRVLMDQHCLPIRAKTAYLMFGHMRYMHTLTQSDMPACPACLPPYTPTETQRQTDTHTQA